MTWAPNYLLAGESHTVKLHDAVGVYIHVVLPLGVCALYHEAVCSRMVDEYLHITLLDAVLEYAPVQRSACLVDDDVPQLLDAAYLAITHPVVTTLSQAIAAAPRRGA